MSNETHDGARITHNASRFTQENVGEKGTELSKSAITNDKSLMTNDKKTMAASRKREDGMKPSMRETWIHDGLKWSSARISWSVRLVRELTMSRRYWWISDLLNSVPFSPTHYT